MSVNSGDDPNQSLDGLEAALGNIAYRSAYQFNGK